MLRRLHPPALLHLAEHGVLHDPSQAGGQPRQGGGVERRRARAPGRGQRVQAAVRQPRAAVVNALPALAHQPQDALIPA